MKSKFAGTRPFATRKLPVRKKNTTLRHIAIILRKTENCFEIQKNPENIEMRKTIHRLIVSGVCLSSRLAGR